MATKTAQKRLTLEYKGLQENPTAYIEAHPNESNILEWFYIITGPPDTPYAGGQFMGTLTFPADYPFNPPAIRMLTPSGRFEPGVRLCLSISDYHPKTWNPSWSVSTILVGLLSFMTSAEQTAGSMTSSEAAKVQFASASKAWNQRNPKFRAQFPELYESQKELVEGPPPRAAVSHEVPSHLTPLGGHPGWGVPAWIYFAGVAVLFSALYTIM